jgi:hypothetical protein
MAWIAVVIEDDLLVEILQVIAHRLNISMTFPMPAARRSTSERVLYMANEARVVPPRPRRFFQSLQSIRKD